MTINISNDELKNIVLKGMGKNDIYFRKTETIYPNIKHKSIGKI